MKILVTGANGYLGQGIVKHILGLGHTVIAADIAVDHVDERAHRLPCDLFSLTDPYEYFGRPDILLHLAWRDGFVHYSDKHILDLPLHYAFLKKMVGATAKEAKEARETGVKVVSVMGSMHEIGFWEGAIKADTPCNPTTPYGISKNALRELTCMLCKQNWKHFLWLRGFYIVGNSQYGSSIFSKITAAEKEGKTSFPFTMGQNQFDFIDYEDFCEQTARAVTQPALLQALQVSLLESAVSALSAVSAVSNAENDTGSKESYIRTESREAVTGVINICSGRPEKLADRVERFIKENGYKIRLAYGSFPDRPYDSKAVWGDSSKIERIIATDTANMTGA